MKNVSIGRKLHKSVAAVMALVFSVISVSPSLAQGAFVGSTLGLLPEPGSMVAVSSAFKPSVLKGIKVFPDNPFRFDFILERGNDSRELADLKPESTKLIKYFLASLTIPETDMWVNLSPYEQDRIVPNEFGLTEMGRDMLAQDYLLKQITASVIYPEGEVGKKFWAEVYKRASDKFGTSDIPLETFNKVWIVPSKAVVFENGDKAFVVESHMKVMLEGDYTLLQNAVTNGKSGVIDASSMEAQELGKNVIRDIVIPILEREVNEGANFAPLRQVYESLILATWFKQKIKDSVLDQVYVDQKKIVGVNIIEEDAKEQIYQMYLKAFKTGVYNYVKEEVDPMTEELLPRKYFSGGWSATNVRETTEITQSSTGIDLTQSNLGVISAQINGGSADDSAMATDTADFYTDVSLGYIAKMPKAKDRDAILVNGVWANVTEVNDRQVTYQFVGEMGKVETTTISANDFTRNVLDKNIVQLSADQVVAINIGREHLKKALLDLSSTDNDLFQEVMKLFGETLGLQPEDKAYSADNMETAGFFGGSFLLVKGKLLQSDINRISKKLLYSFPNVGVDSNSIRLAYSSKVPTSRNARAESEKLIVLLKSSLGQVNDYLTLARQQTKARILEAGREPFRGALEMGQWIKVRIGAEEVTFQRNGDAIIFSYQGITHVLSLANNRQEAVEVINDLVLKVHFSVLIVKKTGEEFFIENLDTKNDLPVEVVSASPVTVQPGVGEVPHVEVKVGDAIVVTEDHQANVYAVRSVDASGTIVAVRQNAYDREVTFQIFAADFDTKVYAGDIKTYTKTDAAPTSNEDVTKFLDSLLALKERNAEAYQMTLKLLGDALSLKVVNSADYDFKRDFKNVQTASADTDAFLWVRGNLTAADENMVLQALALNYARLDINIDNLQLLAVRYGVNDQTAVRENIFTLAAIFEESKALDVLPFVRTLLPQQTITLNLNPEQPTFVSLGGVLFTVQLQGQYNQNLAFTRVGGKALNVSASNEDGASYRDNDRDLRVVLKNRAATILNQGASGIDLDIHGELTPQEVINLPQSKLDMVPELLDAMGIVLSSGAVKTISERKIQLEASRSKLVSQDTAKGEPALLQKLFSSVFGDSQNRAALLSNLLSNGFERSRAILIAKAIATGTIDSSNLFSSSERSRAMEVLLLKAKLWPTASGDKTTLIDLLISQGGILGDYFGLSLEQPQIIFSDNYAEAVLKKKEAIEGREATSEERVKLIQKYSQAAGSTIPIVNGDGKLTSEIIIDSTRSFNRVLTTLLHEIAHSQLISMSDRVVATKESVFIDEGVASDFVGFALSSLTVATRNGAFFGMVDRYRTDRLDSKRPEYLLGMLFIEGVRKNNPEGFSRILQGQMLRVLQGQGANGLNTISRTAFPETTQTDKAQTPGGIDFNAAQMNLAVQNSGENIRFNLDPAMMQQLQNAPGFSPVVVNIAPLNNLSRFLGVEK